MHGGAGRGETTREEGNSGKGKDLHLQHAGETSARRLMGKKRNGFQKALLRVGKEGPHPLILWKERPGYAVQEAVKRGLRLSIGAVRS